MKTALYLTWGVLLFWPLFLTACDAAGQAPLRCLMYLTGYEHFPEGQNGDALFSVQGLIRRSQHPVTPPIDQLTHVSHVALAFMTSGTFNDPDRSEWPLFTTVGETRTKFAPGTKILVAIGGWGDTIGFSVAALTPETRKTFAHNVARMVAATGADGSFPPSTMALAFYV